MDFKAFGFLITSLVALLISFSIGFFFPIDNFYSVIPIPITVIGFFLFGMALYGFLAFVPHIYVGLALGSQRNAIIFVVIFPALIATYAGTKMASLLKDDFDNKKYFLKEAKPVLILLVVAIIFGFAIELLLPYLVTLWPEDFWGLQIQEGRNLGGMWDDLIKYL